MDLALSFLEPMLILFLTLTMGIPVLGNLPTTLVNLMAG